MPTNDNFKEGGSLDTEKCCLCIPIKTGMKIMAILSMIQAVLLIIVGIMALAVPLVAVVFLIMAALPLMVSFQWFKWLKEDNSETTSNVEKWMRIQMFVNGILYILGTILKIAGGEQEIEVNG